METRRSHSRLARSLGEPVETVVVVKEIEVRLPGVFRAWRAMYNLAGVERRMQVNAI